MSPDHDDETKELDAPWPFGPWAHKMAFSKNFSGKHFYLKDM